MFGSWSSCMDSRIGCSCNAQGGHADSGGRRFLREIPYGLWSCLVFLDIFMSNKWVYVYLWRSLAGSVSKVKVLLNASHQSAFIWAWLEMTWLQGVHDHKRANRIKELRIILVDVDWNIFLVPNQFTGCFEMEPTAAACSILWSTVCWCWWIDPGHWIHKSLSDAFRVNSQRQIHNESWSDFDGSLHFKTF